jgi:methyl-accepting chemotaxis protein
MWSNRFLNESPLFWIRHIFNDFFFYKEIKKRRIHQIPSQLSSLSQALNTVTTDTEPHFLKIGEALQTIYTQTNELTQKIMHTIKKIGGDSDESVVTKVADLAKGSLSALQRHQTDIPNNLRHIAHIIESLGRLLILCGWFEKLSAFLRVIAVNIGVESARSVESEELFTVVAQETKKLAENIKEITERLYDDVAQTETNQRSAHCGITDGLEHLNNLAGEGENALNTAVREIEQIMKSAMKIFEQAQFQSQEISKQVGEIVVGIQFHDSMRQRIEHMIQSFMDINRQYKEYESNWRSNNESDPRLGSIHSIMAVQDAQLKQIITDVETVYKNNVGAFEIIGKIVESLVENISREQDQCIGSTRMEESFQNLQFALRNLDQLLHQGRNLVKQMHATAKNASKATGKLSMHMDKVHEISFEMQLKALNAIIKAAHLGEGRTQEVLAQAVNEQSNRSRVFADKIIKSLYSITKSAQNLIDQTGADQPMDGKDYGIGGCLDDSIQEVSDAFAQIKDHSSETFDQVDALKRSISQTQKNHQFMQTLSARLTSFHLELKQMTNRLSPWKMNDQDSAVSWMNQITDHYTMAKERSVHDQVAREKPMSHDVESMMLNTSINEVAEEIFEDAEESVLPMSDENIDDEFGDNVELF